MLIFDKRAEDYLYYNGNKGDLFYGVTLGRVVSTADPQQMGRIYVHCPDIGDPPLMTPEDIQNLPLCSYLSPIGGTTTSTLTRGPTNASTPGPLTYGIWAIPKEGALVAVICVDGNPSNRLWIGCVYEHLVTNTIPTGKFSVNGNSIEGPTTTTDEQLQPLYGNHTQAFRDRSSYEWKTRGADFQAAAVTSEYQQDGPGGKLDDDKATYTQTDGRVIEITQGYAKTRLSTRDYRESSVFSWTTPGSHSFSMDDRIENCRIRLKTTAGHQIILDDTNERIYINTAKGNSWIEIDEDGCIDIFSSEKLSVGAKDINFTAEETVRIYGKKGVHIHSDTDVRTTAKRNIEENAGGQIIETGKQIHMNGPTAKKAFWTNRTPKHEPWARTSTKNDYTHEPKYPYDDPNVGREHKSRGPFWRR